MKKDDIYDILYDALKSLGLTERAVDLYLLILLAGSMSITKIAHQLGVARPNIYKLIAELKEKDLLVLFSNSKDSGPLVVSPSIILEKIRQNEKDHKKVLKKVSSNLPELLSVYTQGVAPSKIKVFEGVEQYIKAFDLIFEEAISPMRFFGSANDFVVFTQWYGYNKLVKKRIRKNIQLQSLLLPSETAEKMKQRASEELREVRILKGLNVFETSFQLFANKILFWQPCRPLAVLIEDEYITKMMESIFKKLWKESDVV